MHYNQEDIKREFEASLEKYLKAVNAMGEDNFIADWVVTASSNHSNLMEQKATEYSMSSRSGQGTHVTFGLLMYAEQRIIKRMRE